MSVFLIKTRQSDFAESHPFCKQSEMQSILDSFEKNNRTRIYRYNGFGTKMEIKKGNNHRRRSNISMPIISSNDKKHNAMQIFHFGMGRTNSV